ncbi:MAG: Rieske (2Fe-2S) protein [Haloferacaceae archaeon]
MTTHEIGTLAEFPENEGRKVTVDGVEFAVFNVDGELYGIHDRCPHKRLPLHVAGEDRFFSSELREEGYCPAAAEKSEDEDIRGGINPAVPSVNCPWHALEFDLETGYNSTTDTRVATYDVDVREDGTVVVEL